MKLRKNSVNIKNKKNKFVKGLKILKLKSWALFAKNDSINSFLKVKKLLSKRKKFISYKTNISYFKFTSLLIRKPRNKKLPSKKHYTIKAIKNLYKLKRNISRTVWKSKYYWSLKSKKNKKSARIIATKGYLNRKVGKTINSNKTLKNKLNTTNIMHRAILPRFTNIKKTNIDEETFSKNITRALFYSPFRFFIKNRNLKQSLFLNYYLTHSFGQNSHILIVEPSVKFFQSPLKNFINMYVKRNLNKTKALHFTKRVTYYQNMYYLINFFVKFTALGVANLFLEHMAVQLQRDSRHWLFLKLLKHLFQITFSQDSLNFNRMRFILKGKFRGPARTSKRLLRFKDNREIPMQTFTSKVDYSHYPADTKYGTISIKLWIFYKKELIKPSQFITTN